MASIDVSKYGLDSAMRRLKRQNERSRIAQETKRNEFHIKGSVKRRTQTLAAIKRTHKNKAKLDAIMQSIKRRMSSRARRIVTLPSDNNAA